MYCMCEFLFYQQLTVSCSFISSFLIIIGQQSSSDIPFTDPNSWNSSVSSTTNAGSQSQIQQQEKGKDSVEETTPKPPQQKQPSQPLPTTQRPATASQILANIQNPSRSKLAPVSKPPGLDPVAILRERESRYRFETLKVKTMLIYSLQMCTTVGCCIRKCSLLKAWFGTKEKYVEKWILYIYMYNIHILYTVTLYYIYSIWIASKEWFILLYMYCMC